jgi:hypothetical protein
MDKIKVYNHHIWAIASKSSLERLKSQDTRKYKSGFKNINLEIQRKPRKVQYETKTQNNTWKLEIRPKHGRLDFNMLIATL